MAKRLSLKSMGAIMVLVLLLDQLTKYYIKSTMQLGESFPVWGDFFRITFVLNPGMAFGVRLENQWLFYGLSLFAALLVFYYLYRLKDDAWPMQTALSLIAAGAIGNLLDRFLYGQVVDFLDFEFFDIHIPPFSVFFFHFPGYQMTRWPVFNVADSAVTVGMIVILLYLLLVGDPMKKNISSSTAHE